jgi:hypothetical protein
MRLQERGSKRQRHILDHPRTLNSGRIGVSLILAEREPLTDGEVKPGPVEPERLENRQLGDLLALPSGEAYACRNR